MRHGTLTAYRNGCRCDECKQASSAYSREYRNRVDRRKYRKAFTYSTTDAIDDLCVILGTA